MVYYITKRRKFKSDFFYLLQRARLCLGTTTSRRTSCPTPISCCGAPASWPWWMSATTPRPMGARWRTASACAAGGLLRPSWPRRTFAPRTWVTSSSPTRTSIMQATPTPSPTRCSISRSASSRSGGMGARARREIPLADGGHRPVRHHASRRASRPRAGSSPSTATGRMCFQASTCARRTTLTPGARNS